MKGSEGGRREGREEGHGWFLSLLDPTDRLDLRGLSMATVLPVVPVLASMAVTLHNVLVATITRILVAYPGSTHDFDGADLVAAPSHSLQGGVVIAHLPLPSSHVITLEKCHTAITVHSRIDGAEGHQPLNAIGIAATPGLPARVISLLQDELLAIEGGVLKTYPDATLHLQGADGLHPVLHDVLAASGEFTTPALEMLLIIDSNLPWSHGH